MNGQLSLSQATVRCAECGAVLAEPEPGDDVAVRCACWQVRLPVAGKTQRPGSVPGQAVAAAAERILTGKANRQHRLILRGLLEAGDAGLTQPQIGLLPGVDDRAHRTRRLELTEAGLIQPTNRTRRITYTDAKGELVHGKMAVVYVITPAGRQRA